MNGSRWVRSIFTLTLTAATLGVTGVVIKSAHDVRATASELPQQLAAAKREGIPTAAAELAAENFTDGAHNAAPIYDDAIKLLKSVGSDRIDNGLKSSAHVLRGRASMAQKEQAHLEMLGFGPALEKAILGSVRTNCAFTPTWSLGSGYPQLKPLTTLARLLAARAALDHDLTDLFAAVRVTNHIGLIPVLEAEQEQTIAIEDTCLAAWEIAKADPTNALTCKTLLEELPGIRLERRVGGELLRALTAIKGLGASPNDALHEMVALPGSPQLTEAYETEVVRSLRAIHRLAKNAKRYPDIEDGLLAIEAGSKDDHSLAGRVLYVLIGPWSQTAHAARRAQERKASTIQALTMLGQKPLDCPKVGDPSVA